MRDLNGHEKRKLFENINLVELFPDLENVKTVDTIWKDFFNIFMSVNFNSYPQKDKVNLIKTETKKWIDTFIKIYHIDRITPYMHSFGQHLHELIEIHDDISLYTMQGNILEFCL